MSDTIKTFNDTLTLTRLGMELRQKVMSGGEYDEDGKKTNPYTVEFTHAALGTGRPDSSAAAFLLTDLVSHAMDAPVKKNYAEDVNHLMTVVITNAGLTEDLMAAEIGIYARVINEKTGEAVIPEVLYCYAWTDMYEYLPAFRQNNLTYREFTFNTVLSLASEVNVTFDMSKVYATHEDMETRLERFTEELESGGLLGGGTSHVCDAPIVSDTEPGAEYAVWHKPMGAISLTDAIGIPAEENITVTGIFVSDEPPEDTGTLWARPVNE